ncbi:hypothetical protein LINPERPRIM_LOCUS25516 [Linum perenne]
MRSRLLPMFEQDPQFVEGRSAEVPSQQFRIRTMVAADGTVISSPVEIVCPIGTCKQPHDQVTPVTQHFSNHKIKTYAFEYQGQEFLMAESMHYQLLQYRRSEGKTLVRGGKALQHFIIDAFTTVEQNRLVYLQNHQKDLRSEAYEGLYFALHRGESNARNLDRIILSSSFTGGIRYMKQLFFDTTAICHYFGNPNLFITFTSNAQWPEITNTFKNDVGTHGEDKPQIVARVFRLKLLRLKKDIDNGKLFGKIAAG